MYIGNCINQELVEEIFGSVSEFARQVELNGNSFTYGKYKIKYNAKTDIHSFFEK